MYVSTQAIKTKQKNNIFYTKWKKAISGAQPPGRWWLIEERSPKTELLVRPEAGFGPAASHMRPGVRRSYSTTHSWLTASYALGITSPVFAEMSQIVPGSDYNSKSILRRLSETGSFWSRTETICPQNKCRFRDDVTALANRSGPTLDSNY